MKEKIKLIKNGQGVNYLVPFILVTSLFFLWGFAHSILDVLNKHFQEILSMSKAESGLVQFSVYFGYFVAAIPAGLFMHRFGYRKGIIFGLLLYAGGAFLFYPATYIQSFWPFLAALMIIAFGLTFLETAANPYVSVLGPKESAERRLNFSQSFNGLGWIFGPLIGGLLIFSPGSGGANKFSSMALPYIGIGCVVLMVGVLFYFIHLPEITGSTRQEEKDVRIRQLFSHPHFILAVVAQFFYVAAQTGVNSFFINYVTENIEGITNLQAAQILSFGGMGLFFAGRLSGSFFMRKFAPNKLLSTYAAICVFLMLMVVAGLGWFSVTALFVTYFFMSIMFPTIFVLGLKELGPLTKKASSFIVMSIVGGALCPMLMGYIADKSSMQWGFVVPLVCFGVVLYYGLSGFRVRKV
ncbi:MAG: L-fucose:H+ symporter permease [Bacteroidetes bacterium]|nr:L-fucose:H+ symporter permease [Bacteroidota bacterium]